MIIFIGYFLGISSLTFTYCISNNIELSEIGWFGSHQRLRSYWGVNSWDSLVRNIIVLTIIDKFGIGGCPSCLYIIFDLLKDAGPVLRMVCYLMSPLS